MTKHPRFLSRLTALTLLLCLSVTCASAATVFRPRNEQDANLQALSCFRDCTFGAEYRSATDLLTRWEGPIRLCVCGTPTLKDRLTLERFLKDLNGNVPGLPELILTKSEVDANIRIYFCPLDQMTHYLDDSIAGNWGAFLYAYDTATYLRTAGWIAIATDVTTQKQRNHLLMEELVGVLGLSQDHETYSDSILYQPWTETQALSDVDWRMLNMLYDPEVLPGMTAQQVWDILYPRYAGQ